MIVIVKHAATFPRKLLVLRIVFLIVMSYSCPVYSLDPNPVRVERGVKVAMRDGTQLVADVYRPNIPGKFTVLLQRTPYNRASSSDFSPQTFAFRPASRGYIVIMQDVRGRFESEGEWYPFKYEERDGYDTVEWAAALPYSDGRVAMFGASYVGATQMRAAIASPPHLGAVFP